MSAGVERHAWKRRAWPARGHSGARPLARAGRALRDLPPRPARRRRHQGREAALGFVGGGGTSLSTIAHPFRAGPAPTRGQSVDLLKSARAGHFARLHTRPSPSAPTPDGGSREPARSRHGFPDLGTGNPRLKGSATLRSHRRSGPNPAKRGHVDDAPPRHSRPPFGRGVWPLHAARLAWLPMASPCTASATICAVTAERVHPR
jgi:hypothetical protein